MPIKYNPAPCSQEELRALLDYNPETGKFTWKLNRGGSAKKGAEAGRPRRGGYWAISVFNRRYFAHRLAWLWVHGEWPKEDLDHIDGDPSNNTIANLRACTRGENNQNAGLRRDSANSSKGVKFHPVEAKWSARIGRDGVSYYLGLYATEAEAHAAYRGAKVILHTFNPVLRA